MSKSKGKVTPLMKQFNAIKAKHPGAILLFRVGDFYETFGEDAVEAARILGIVLTKRNNGGSDLELAGFPHHSLDTYLPKLVRAGKRVAVCDQLEDPKATKGIVKRGVTELVTPGVAFSDKVLERNEANFLAAVHFDGKFVGLSFLEASTGDFFCCHGDANYASKILGTLAPSEVLVSKPDLRRFKENIGDKFYLTRLDEWVWQPDYTNEKLLSHFGTNSLKGFGVEDEKLGSIAAGAILHYLENNQQKRLGHIARIYRFDDSDFVWLDQFTVRNLELVYPLHPDGTPLVEVLDHTLTPMGARMLRRAIILPLKDATRIKQRLQVVETFLLQNSHMHSLAGQLKRLGDLERLASKVATMRLNPREAALLRESLSLIAPIKETLKAFKTKPLTKYAKGFSDVTSTIEVLFKYLQDEPNGQLNEGNVIRDGLNAELDELRNIKQNGKDYLLAMQKREHDRTGISSLKIGFNKVFGYYLEVTNAHKDKVPPEWIRKQTLTNAERYITEELKEYEEKIMGAEDKIQSLEYTLYQDFLQDLQHHIQAIQINANHIAELDMLLGFATVAQANGYVKPTVDSSHNIDIRQGRHPVIERNLPPDAPYVPNDVFLDNKTQQIVIVTGPNMAGKSALLRQTALIVLMAQMGSFVPADEATIGAVDKVFTRVGASDNISSGESTFMVEMNETAQIANNATNRSLVLLDEIGRGTSTYDGVSIAWALVEYLHNTKGGKAKTLFATHYHELNELENRLERVRNYNVSVHEVDGKVLFLRTLKPGGSNHSFGINVADMAGMPPNVVKRARELLMHFEASRMDDAEAAKTIKFADKQPLQLNMFELKDSDTLKIRETLAGVDIDRMTPVEALLKLQEIKRALL